MSSIFGAHEIEVHELGFKTGIGKACPPMSLLSLPEADNKAGHCSQDHGELWIGKTKGDLRIR